MARLDAADAGEQLARQKVNVLSAIDQACVAATGNDQLLEQLAAIRRAIAGAGSSADSQADDTAGALRASLAARFPDALTATTPITVSHDASLDVLTRVVGELGQMVVSPRGVDATLRDELRRDFDVAIDATLETLRRRPDQTLGRMSPDVEQAVWRRWAQVATPDVKAALLAELREAAGPDGRSALMRADALVAEHPPPSVAAELSGELLSRVLPALQRVLSFRRRRLDELRTRSERSDLTALEQLADRLAPSLAAIDDLLVGYFRLRERLDDVGLERAERNLGATVARSEIDPERHSAPAGENAEQFLIRTHGLRVRGGTTRQALLVPVDPATP